MKAFLEEYGFAILAAIVVIVLIMMASPIGEAVRKSLKSIVEKFTNTADNGLGAADDKIANVFTNMAKQ